MHLTGLLRIFGAAHSTVRQLKGYIARTDANDQKTKNVRFNITDTILVFVASVSRDSEPQSEMASGGWNFESKLRYYLAWIPFQFVGRFSNFGAAIFRRRLSFAKLSRLNAIFSKQRTPRNVQPSQIIVSTGSRD